MNTAEPAFTDDERTVLRELAAWNDERIPYLREAAIDMGLPVEAVRRACRRLLADGLATYGPLHDLDDGKPMGSSYWLTQNGVETAVRLAGRRP